MSKIGVEARKIGAQVRKSCGNRKKCLHAYFVRGEVMADPTATPHGDPPRSVEHFFGTRKIKNVNLRSSSAELSSGTHITHP